MKTLSGTVDCETEKTIPTNAIVLVSVNDECIGCGPVIKIAEKEYNDIKSFPFEYKIEFDEKKIVHPIPFGYRLVFRIVDKLNPKKLLFLNDQGNTFMQNDGSFLDRVNIKLMKYPESV